MLSSAVLSGIPEVNLGMKAKFENIEKTEHARVTFIEKTREKAKNRAMAKRTADGEPKPTKIVVSREDSGLNFGRARFMGGNRGAGSNAGSSEGVVDVGSELTDHGKVFEMAKKKGLLFVLSHNPWKRTDLYCHVRPHFFHNCQNIIALHLGSPHPPLRAPLSSESG